MQKSCAKCTQQFKVTDEDLKFYDEVSPVFNEKKYPIPPPTFCPDCRQQRRLAWRNERTLYFRKCDLTGKQIMSVYSPEKPFPVYHVEEWYSDKWDAKDYGRDFDFSRPFFEQFEELMNKVPQLSLSVVANQNSDYINQAGWNKNCYLIFEAINNDNCFYGNYINFCRDCLDTINILKSELCYECIDCQNCYNLKFSQDCVNCSDSWFLKDCTGCSNCFGCVNLKNKEYHFFNEKYTKEEYEQKIQSVNPKTNEGFKQIQEKIDEFAKKFPRKYMQGIQNENSTGNYISNTQNCFNCFDLTNSQDCKNIISAMNMKKVHDVSAFGADRGAEFSYESHEIGDGVRNVCFSDQIWGGGSDVYYSKLCTKGITQLFGCVGLKHSKYCILNKQYTKEEYDKLVPRIIEHMKKTGEWGEFFPAKLSPFGYNETLASVYHPLSKEESLAKGYKWKDEKEQKPAQPTITQIPTEIENTPDSITQEILKCNDCEKSFKIIAQELSYYRKMGLPIPNTCPECRHEKRMSKRNPRKLWDRKCDKCSAEIQTTYAPESPATVYCEKCYLKAVY